MLDARPAQHSARGDDLRQALRRLPVQGRRDVPGLPLPQALALVLSKPQHRQSAKTRSWSEAEKVKRQVESQFGGGSEPGVEVSEKTTIKQAIDSFLMRKHTEGVTAGVLGKYTRELARLQAFFTGKSKFFPHDVTLPLLEQFRAGWVTDYPSSYT